jgi:hypothetical protein
MKVNLMITLFALFFNSSKSQTVKNKEIEKKVIVKSNVLHTTLTKVKIISYIKKISNSNTSFKNEFIKKVEDNMEFDKMYMERRYKDQKFIIIPMKKVYFSQHANKKNSIPIQYMVVVEKDNDKGKIWRADLILVYPKDKNISILPKNAFLDFASQNISQIDATYTYVNWNDVKQGETIVENGKRKEVRVWASKKNITDDCRIWTLETTIINEDGTITEKKQDLGKTCTECPPGDKCDPVKK